MGPARQAKTPVSNFSFYDDEFRAFLRTLLQEIFSPKEAFTQTEHTKLCQYCEYRSLCGRG